MTTSSPAQASHDQFEEPVAGSYEVALQELEQLLTKLESDQLPLDQLLAHYQRGADLLAFCRGKLQAVENQIKIMQNGEVKSWDGP